MSVCKLYETHKSGQRVWHYILLLDAMLHCIRNLKTTKNILQRQIIHTQNPIFFLPRFV